jgi:hypothetical protein
MTDLLKGILGGTQAQAPGSSQRLGLGAILDPEIGLPMAAALLGNQGNMQNVGNAFGAMAPAVAQKKERNKTYDWLKANAPEYAQLIDGGAPPSLALELYAKNKFGGSAAGGTRYSMNPIYGTDPETGETVLGTVGNDASFKRIDTGGFQVAAGIDKVDAGTHWLLYDKRTGQMVGREEKDLAGAEAQKEIGTARGKAAGAAAGDFQAGQNALDLIGSLRDDPNRRRGTGMSSVFNSVPGTRGYDYQTKVNQATSGAFLSAIQQLRGMGALSNAEGSTATQAVTRMNTATSEGEFLAALDDYEKIVLQGMDRSQNAGGGSGVDMPQAPTAPSGGARRTSNGVTYTVDE